MSDRYTHTAKKIAVKYCKENGEYVPKEKWMLIVTDTKDGDTIEFFYDSLKGCEEHIKDLAKINKKLENKRGKQSERIVF